MTAGAHDEPGLAPGDRRALAKAITLVESTLPADRQAARRLVASAAAGTGPAARIGISGPPGAGKSTLIEALGNHILDAGHRLAVLAVDPTSTVSGGSILGDKTRMATLARRPEAYVRPSPAGSTLGGVARRTRECIVLCEAFGADVVIVETVGVGQSEVAVAGMTDVFVLLAPPGGGDDLQGIKRGVMELADLVVVTKCDGDLTAAAQRTVADHRAAVRLLARRDLDVMPTVRAVSAVTGDGVAELWQAITGVHAALEASGALEQRRARQRVAWMWDEVRDALAERVSRRGADVAALEADVAGGGVTPQDAAMRLVRDAFATPPAAER